MFYLFKVLSRRDDTASMPVECESERGSDAPFTATSNLYGLSVPLVAARNLLLLHTLGVSILLSEGRIILYGFMDQGKEKVVVLGCWTK
jgi:hypothetical protein